ncbi:MAG: DUF58 domain-containing protein [Nanoarchaeota archaeon]
MPKKFKTNFGSNIAAIQRAKSLKYRRSIYERAFGGKGMEFDSYRNLTPDDDAALIDWKASARANELIVKQYVEERNLDVYFAVNVSNSMLFGSKDILKSEYAIDLILTFSHLVLGSGDNIGLVMFTDHFVKVIPASKNIKQFNLFIKFLTEPELYGGNTDFGKIVNNMLNFTKSSSMLILISDFIHLKKGFEKELKFLAHKCETMAIMVRDKMDEELPDIPCQMVVQDPFSKNQMLIEPQLVADKYKENALLQKNAVKKIFRESNIDILELSTDKPFIMPLMNFLKERTRRRRYG